MENLINNFYELKLEKDQIDEQINDLKETSDTLELQLKTLRSQITQELKNKSLETFKTDKNFIAVYSEKLSTTWVDEAKLKDDLHNNGYDKFIKSKITESLDKNAIKKALKTDSDLCKIVGPSIIQEPKATTIITTIDNYEKMLSEIKDNADD